MLIVQGPPAAPLPSFEEGGFAPQSHGTPVQNCASNRFPILAADSTIEDYSVSQTIPATPHALDEAGVLGQSTTLLDDLECDLTSRHRSSAGREQTASSMQADGVQGLTLSLSRTLCTNPPGDTSCWCHQERQQSKVHRGRVMWFPVKPEPLISSLETWGGGLEPCQWGHHCPDSSAIIERSSDVGCRSAGF